MTVPQTNEVLEINLPEAIAQLENEEGLINYELLDLMDTDNPEFEIKKKFSKYKNIPGVFKKSIQRNGIVALVFLISSIVVYFSKEFGQLFPLILLGLSFYFGYASLSYYRIGKYQMYTTFRGKIVHVRKRGVSLLKNSQSLIIKVSDGRKYLSFSSPVQKINEFVTDLPITLYLSPNQSVIDSEDGPFVQQVLAIEYSADSQAVNQLLQKNQGQINVSEYISKEVDTLIDEEYQEDNQKEDETSSESLL